MSNRQKQYKRNMDSLEPKIAIGNAKNGGQIGVITRCDSWYHTSSWYKFTKSRLTPGVPSCPGNLHTQTSYVFFIGPDYILHRSGWCYNSGKFRFFGKRNVNWMKKINSSCKVKIR
jgi:hypothetical protein